MEFSIEKNNLEKHRNICIVVGIFELCCFSPTAKIIDKISGGYISDLLNKKEIEGKIGQTLLLYNIPNMISERILLLGCGREQELNNLKYKQIIKKMIDVLINTASIEANLFLTELDFKERNTYWKVRQTIEIIEECLYAFDQLKTIKNISNRSLCKINFNVSTDQELTSGKRAIQHSIAISSAIKIAKDLGNMPPNICNSAYLSSQAIKLADNFSKNITTSIINEEQMSKLGMHSYLAVGNSSQNESLMSVIEYKGSVEENISYCRPIVLIGKGVTFDSGGISIKHSEGMDEMKYDMCGAASVYGIMQMVAELQLPLNVIGILASCENMPGRQAYRPGDVITTMSGKTVEVINTDAEGRLILCDVLTYVERFEPEIVIDIATLTGACVIALGHHITGLMSNSDSLAHELIKASEQSGDRAWLLPLSEEFQDQLESNFADMANVGGRPGGVITAGCFLSRFASKYSWAHLDIAGTAWLSGKKKGATGRPIAMLSQFLLNRTNLMT